MIFVALWRWCEVPVRTSAAMGIVIGLALGGSRGYAQEQEGPAVIDIGSRRELLVDDYLSERFEGGAALRLHHPIPREIAIEHDAPWEGSGSGYHSVFKDGNLYRMYYKAWHLDVSGGKLNSGAHPLYCCYAESDDGIHWRKPELDLVEFQGSTRNNIVLAPEAHGDVLSDPGHPAVFLDENPSCPPEAKYKAIIRAARPRGLLVFRSPDGIHFTLMHPEPVITEGAFDSQNLAFFDPNLGAYRAYWRIFTQGRRDIRTAVSPDLVHWQPWRDLEYVDSPPEHLYTNVVKPYFRAPHLLIGFPTRYVERPWSEEMRALPEPEHRELRSRASPRYGTAVTEALFMVSRDGVRFKRWNEAFLAPGIERPGTWHYGHQYLAWHVVPTKNVLPGAPDELSFYATESYWTGKSSVLRRYTLRMDGFVSVYAPLSGGEWISKPLRFDGHNLFVNFATSAAGSLRVELQDDSGQPLPGFALADCRELFGDTTDRVVRWKGGSDLGSLAGKTIRLRCELRDAHLFAFQFRNGMPAE